MNDAGTPFGFGIVIEWWCAAAAGAASGGRRIHYAGLSHVARITTAAILPTHILLCCCTGWFHCEGEAAKRRSGGVVCVLFAFACV